jgi:hypothetical protein
MYHRRLRLQLDLRWVSRRMALAGCNPSEPIATAPEAAPAAAARPHIPIEPGWLEEEVAWSLSKP